MAEREGFEPSAPFKAVHTISSRAPSTTRTPLHISAQVTLSLYTMAVAVAIRSFEKLCPPNREFHSTALLRFCQPEGSGKNETGYPAIQPNIRNIAIGGEGGIRTHGAFDSTLDFESSTFDHSDTSPYMHGRSLRPCCNQFDRRRSRKNSFISPEHSSALTPASTSI